MTAIHERLKELRIMGNYTQAQLAEKLGVTPQAISFYEKGREPDYELLVKVAELFSVTTDYLLGRTGNKNIEDVPIGEALTLTDKSIKNIKEYSQINFLNAFLENKEFYKILDDADLYMLNYPVTADESGPIYDKGYRKFELSNDFINLIDSIQESGILNSEEYKKIFKQRNPYEITIGGGKK